MHTASEQRNATCPHCPSLNLLYTNVGGFKVTPENVAAAKEKFFHGQLKCSRCANVQRENIIGLCCRCEHLRLHHILVCNDYEKDYFNIQDIVGIPIYPLLQDSHDCYFCQFVSELIRQVSSHAGVSIELKPDKAFMIKWVDKAGISFNEGAKFSITSRGIPEIYLFVNESLSLSSALETVGLNRPHQGLSKRLEWPVLSGTFSTRPNRGLIEYINWAVVRKFLTIDPSERRIPVSISTEPLSKLTDFRVIDTFQECLTSLPPGATYLALSYVWGKSEVPQVQLCRSNLDLLKQSITDTGIPLPRTITDAIEVCRKLDQRYLWIDRLCIIQDDAIEIKTAQLNEMGKIYQLAKYVIVALAGDGATYGLPGVTIPRRCGQKALPFETFSICEEVPHLRDIIKSSNWATRGWTFQESEASGRCLYFTDYGAYYVDYSPGRGKVVEIEQEAIDYTFAGRYPQGIRSSFYVELVANYSQRTLTFPNDILRAVSGVLYNMYRSRTMFGLPWADFDRAALWYVDADNGMPAPTPGSDVFPSWSWISVPGKKTFHSTQSAVHGLAYWARVAGIDASPASVSDVDVAKPLEADLRSFHRNYDYDSEENIQEHGVELPKDRGQARIALGLAWREGCLRTPAPRAISKHCSFSTYKRRMLSQWTSYSVCWKHLFADYRPRDLFTPLNIELGSVPGRLMVHTQKQSLRVDAARKNAETPYSASSLSGYDQCFIRSAKGGLIGKVYFDQPDSQRLIDSTARQAEFLAMSISTQDQFYNLVDFDERGHIPWSSHLYGCPCHQTSPDEKTTNATEHHDHIVECANHSAFQTPLPHWEAVEETRDWMLENFPNIQLNMMEVARHLHDVSYFGRRDGELMHPWHDVPKIQVMMITPSTIGKVGRTVYRRVGLGTVYLKRWVEANPTFETVILE